MVLTLMLLTIEFIEVCEGNQIALNCLQPHSTYSLQPLDVGLFGPLQNYYSKVLDDSLRKGIYSIHTGNFLSLYLQT